MRKCKASNMSTPCQYRRELRCPCCAVLIGHYCSTLETQGEWNGDGACDIEREQLGGISINGIPLTEYLSTLTVGQQAREE